MKKDTHVTIMAFMIVFMIGFLAGGLIMHESIRISQQQVEGE
jgi:uncharacterized membrane protein YhiD involved in acid resistance